MWFAVGYFTGFKGLGLVLRQYTHPFAAFYTYFRISRTHFTSQPYAHTHVRTGVRAGAVFSLAGIYRNETVELTRTKSYENV